MLSAAGRLSSDHLAKVLHRTYLEDWVRRSGNSRFDEAIQSYAVTTYAPAPIDIFIHSQSIEVMVLAMAPAAEWL